MRLLFFIEKYFGVILMTLLILEGIIAFLAIFIFPPLSILMVFVGVMTLAFSVVLKEILRMTIRLLCHLLELDTPSFDS